VGLRTKAIVVLLVATAAGESIGSASQSLCAALVSWNLDPAETSPVLPLLAMIGAGSLEGLWVGLGQLVALQLLGIRGHLGLVLGTTAAFTLAWAIGVSGLIEPVDVASPAAIFTAAAITGALLGLLVGFAQWLALRRALAPAWITATIPAWTIGMLVQSATAAYVLPSGEWNAGAVAISAAGGAVTGAIVGATQALGLAPVTKENGRRPA
jgi:hypothetical protein